MSLSQIQVQWSVNNQHLGEGSLVKVHIYDVFKCKAFIVVSPSTINGQPRPAHETYCQCTSKEIKVPILVILYILLVQTCHSKPKMWFNICIQATGIKYKFNIFARLDSLFEFIVINNSHIPMVHFTSLQFLLCKSQMTVFELHIRFLISFTLQ